MLELEALSLGSLLYQPEQAIQIAVQGEDRTSFLHNLTTNDVKILQPGQLQKTVISTVKGRIFGAGHLYCLQDELLFAGQASSTEALLKHFDFYHFSEDVRFEDRTPAQALLLLAGSKATQVLPQAAHLALNQHTQTQIDGQPALVAKILLFGQEAYQVLVPSEAASKISILLVEAGAKKIDAEAWNRLRLHHGEPAFGFELGVERNPLEAGLYDSVSFDKGCYLGQEVIARLDTYNKVSRVLGLFQLPPEAAAFLHDKPILTAAEAQEAGWLTSWAQALDQPGFRALGYVQRRFMAQPMMLAGAIPTTPQRWIEGK